MAVSAPTRTSCPYCGVGCGVLASPAGEGGPSIAGDPHHPANFGRLCSKGAALGETLALEARLLYPEIAGRRSSWEQALDHVASELARIAAQYGPRAIAFYLSGQLLTEDYYVANKLAKGFIGTPHVDTNSRLCMASSVAGHRRAFGADVVPQCYEDLEIADLVVLVGSNAAWCHPVLYQRIQVARGERGMRLVVIDPRRTATCEGADLHLAIRPGTDAQLWNGLLVWLAQCGVLDRAFIDGHTAGFAETLAEAQRSGCSVAGVAAGTGLRPADIETFYRWWAGSRRVVSGYSQGVNQSAQGTDKVNAIINCHLATGRIGKPGAGPLSLTGQPNAMGGREVGGLANMLAAHMGFSAAERDRVRRFWDAPNVVPAEGYKAVQMFEAIASGEIKALWVMATNPAVSLPRADAMRLALRGLELFVVSENVAANDTVRLAHVRLPATAWGEKDGSVTNSERCISRQRAFLPVPGEARADWWMLAQVAGRLGWGAQFDYRSPADIFREHARLSGFENHGGRAFDISPLAGISDADYAGLEPVQWPLTGDARGQARLFGDGKFLTPSGRAQFIPVVAARLAVAPSQQWPFVLNTGRVRDQWHTMTRTGLSPRLSVHLAEPYVEVHPSDAERIGLEQGMLARVETAMGSADLRVLVADGQKPGTLFVPIHWSSENSSAARIGALVHAVTDAISGQPDAKGTPARLGAVAVTHYGFVLSRSTVPRHAMRYWTCARTSFGHMTNFALDAAPDRGWRAWSSDLLPAGEYLSVEDHRCGLYRVAVLSGGRLEAVLCVAGDPKLPSPEWFKAQFALDAIPPGARRDMLAGALAAGASDQGAIVCVCFQVGVRDIQSAAAAGNRTVTAIGHVLGAGTNCGSCIPEITRLIAGKQAVREGA